EALGTGVERRPEDAEVGGEAGEEDPLKAALAQIAGEAGAGALVVLGESGIGIDVAAEALAQHELGRGDVEIGVEGGAVGALHAMVRPEHLIAIVGADRLERLPARMRRGEGAVAGRVPVLGQDHVLEAPREPVYQRHDGIALGHGERAAGAEIVLDVDDEEDVGRAWRDRFGHSLLPLVWASCSATSRRTMGISSSPYCTASGNGS